MVEGNDLYEFMDGGIWKKDNRMGRFAAELKRQKWTDIPDSDMKILKLAHLIQHDFMSPLRVAEGTGREKPENWIFLRPEAKEIWDFIFEKLTTKAGDKPMAFYQVSGNSGIGKSYSMLYLLKLFLDKGRLVFFDHRKTGRLYAFIPVKRDETTTDAQVTYNVFAALKAEFKSQDKSEQSLLSKFPELVLPPVLWDPAEQKEDNFRPNYLAECRTALAVSLKEQGLVKNPGKDYDIDNRYLRQYSLAQLETIRSLAYPTRFTDQEIRYRFYRYGGLIRIVFGSTELLKDFHTTINEGIIGLNQEKLEMILQNVVGDQYTTISSGVFEVKPNPEDPSQKVLDFGSPYVYALLALKFWQFMAQQRRGENRRYTTWFEAMVIHRLAEGGTFKVRKSSEQEWTDLVLPRIPVENISGDDSDTVNSAFYTKWAGLQEGTSMLAPVSDNLPVVDCADKSGRGYQITAAQSSHQIAYDDCGKILEAHGNESRLELYFAVPDWNADEFPKQSFKGVGKGPNRYSARVDQYVLRIDCDHIHSLVALYEQKEAAIEKGLVERVAKAQKTRKRSRL